MKEKANRLFYTPRQHGDHILPSRNALTNRTGFVNVGNTSYINSVLQALSMSFDFCTSVRTCTTSSTGPFLNLFKSFVNSHHQRHIYWDIRSTDIEVLKYIDRINPPSVYYTHTTTSNGPHRQCFLQRPQQDAHEFLNFLLQHSLNSDSDIALKTQIFGIFNFDLCMRRTCLYQDCQHTSFSEEPANFLQIHLKDEILLRTRGRADPNNQICISVNILLMNYFAANEDNAISDY